MFDLSIKVNKVKVSDDVTTHTIRWPRTATCEGCSKIPTSSISCKSTVECSTSYTCNCA